MNLSSKCLDEVRVELLLRGDLSPREYQSAQDHLETCEHCRREVEATIGPEQWWEDVASTLKSLPPTPDGNQPIEDECSFAKSEREEARCGDTRVGGKLFELLGPTDDPNMLGRIGPYEIIGILGQGGMGAVFKGFDRSLNRFVAIKMLLPHLSASGAARKRFAREAQAVAAVVDDHVMAIHCVDQWQGVPYFVMTYARGDSLQKRINRNGPLEVREILRIGMQAAKGLAAAHAQGIVHRDIKPANIFLDQNVERVQLMDFGLARAVDDASLTRTGMLAGTPQYMSPEQARAETVDHRSDLFSLGSVMYAMCTGHAPFRSETSYGVLRLITDTEPRPIRELNPDIPDWLVAIITQLMAKNAGDRHQSAAALADQLQVGLAHVQNPTAGPVPDVLRTPCSSREGGDSKSLTGVSQMFVSKFVWIALSVFGLAAAAFWATPSQVSDEEQLASLQGEWKLESMTRSGVTASADQLFNERIVFESSQFARLQTAPNGQEIRGEAGRCSVGMKNKLKTIDFHLSAGTIYGIYELAEDKLVLCLTKEGGARPDAFSSIPNDNKVLQRFVRTGKPPQVPPVQARQAPWVDTWLKRIPSELPKDATEARKWMEDNKFEAIRTGELSAESAKAINPDVELKAYEELGAKSYLFGRLKSESKFASSPTIEVYCLINTSNSVVGMQVTPMQK